MNMPKQETIREIFNTTGAKRMFDLIKISEKEMCTVKNNFSFYDFSEQDSIKNSSIAVELKAREIITYSDLCLGKPKETFLSQRSRIINLLNQFLQLQKEEYCILSKYHDNKWLVNEKKTCELYRSLKKNKVKNRFKGGIKLSCKDKLLFSFLDSNLKYNSFFNILLPNNKIIITPTDHMDIFFDAENIEEVKVDLEKLLYNSKFFNIRFFEPENPIL